MDINLKSHPGHTNRIYHPFLIIKKELLGNGIDDLTIKRNGHGPGRIQYLLDITGTNFTIFDPDNTVAVKALEMAAGNAGLNDLNFLAAHLFGLFYSLTD